MFPIFLETAANDPTAGLASTLFMVVALFAVMYFMMIRPQKKKDKELADMRNSMDIGDGIVTIGGIVGRIVALKDDTVVIETGTDRTRIRFKRWAIQEVEKLELE